MFCHSGEACAGLDPVTGIQSIQLASNWTPASAGVTTFSNRQFYVSGSSYRLEQIYPAIELGGLLTLSRL